MKLLLDECLPRKFKHHLHGHECHTVPEEGWAGKKNGDLLSLAEKSGFEVFLTLDRGGVRAKPPGTRDCCHPDIRKVQPPG
jgi:hypothetical protein